MCPPCDCADHNGRAPGTWRGIPSRCPFAHPCLLCSYWKGGVQLSELLSVATATDEAAWKLQASSGMLSALMLLDLRRPAILQQR